MVDNTQTDAAHSGGSYLSWGPVLGGAVVAGAIATVLTQFGVGVGLSVGDTPTASGEVSWAVIGASIWVILVAIVSSAVGGYIAGRTRPRWGDAKPEEIEFRDGAHGLAVWATATLFVFFVSSVVGAIAGLGAAASAGGAAADPSQEMIRATTNISTIFAFGTAAGAALGAGAAWFSAGIGGEHRDANLSINTATPAVWRRRS